MALAAIGGAPVANSVSQRKCAALTVFSDVQVGRSPLPTAQEGLHLHEKHSDVPRFETTTDCSRSWHVRGTGNITVAPRCRQVATGRPELEEGHSRPLLVCLEPAPLTPGNNPIAVNNNNNYYYYYKGGSSRPCSHTSRDVHTSALKSDVTVRLCWNWSSSKSLKCDDRKCQRWAAHVT